MLREVTFKIKENSYKVKFDKVGQLQDIEILKAHISKGMYADLMRNSTYESSFALDMIDIEATLTVLCPELKEKHYKGIDSLRDLNFEDAIELKKAFVSQIVPYLNDIRSLMKPETKPTIDE